MGAGQTVSVDCRILARMEDGIATRPRDLYGGVFAYYTFSADFLHKPNGSLCLVSVDKDNGKWWAPHMGERYLWVG